MVRGDPTRGDLAAGTLMCGVVGTGSGTRDGQDHSQDPVRPF